MKFVWDELDIVEDRSSSVNVVLLLASIGTCNAIDGTLQKEQ